MSEFERIVEVQNQSTQELSEFDLSGMGFSDDAIDEYLAYSKEDEEQE